MPFCKTVKNGQIGASLKSVVWDASRGAYGPISGAVVQVVFWIIPDRSNRRLAGFRVMVLVQMGLAGDDVAMAANDRFTDPVQMTATVADPDDPDYRRGHADATAGKPREGHTGQYHKGYDDGLNAKSK